MDAKITKTRLVQMLSYDWIKIIAAALAVIIFWVFIFTWSATRITNTQKFVIHNYFGVSLGDGYYTAGYNTFGKGKVFSYEVFETENVNLNQGSDVSYQLLEGRYAVGEMDVIIMADITNPDAYFDKDGNQLYEVKEGIEYTQKSYLETFSRSSYFKGTTRLDDADGKDGFFTQMKTYLSKFYTVVSEAEKTFGTTVLTVADFDENSLDEQKVKDLFTARANANKDKRFKTEAEWQKGYKDEIARIQSYQKAYEEFFSYLEKGYIALTPWNYASTTPLFKTGGVYSINLCPNEDLMGDLKKDFFYRLQDADKKYYSTAKDMNIVFMELDELDPDFKYENLLLVNQMIKRHGANL